MYKAIKLFRNKMFLLPANKHLLMVFLTFAVMFIACEFMVRLLVPAEIFYPVSNIYQRSEDPDLPYTMKAHYQGTEFGADLQTNALGYRGPDWLTKKPEHVRRVVLLGDSFTFGYGVPYRATFGQVLERQLNEAGDNAPVYEVLNFGMNGYNTRQQLRLLRQRIFSYEPEMAVLFVTTNDHEPEWEAAPGGWLRLPQTNTNPDRDGRLLFEAAPFFSHFQYLTIRHSYLAKFLSVAFSKSSGADSHTERLEDGKLAEGLAWRKRTEKSRMSVDLEKNVYGPLIEMQALCAKYGVEFFVIFLGGSEDYDLMRRILMSQDRVKGFSVPELFPEINNWKEFTSRFGLGWDDHMNAEAHDRIGRTLAEYVDAAIQT